MEPLPLPLPDMPANIMFLAAIVIMTTEVLKRIFKVKDTWAAGIAIVSGVVLGLLTQVAVDYPKMQPYYEKALWGLVIGLAAAGGYSIFKSITSYGTTGTSDTTTTSTTVTTERTE